MKPDTQQTQIEKIKTDLLQGVRLDSVLAFEVHFITRLAPIIERLRKREGWPVITERLHKNGLGVYYLPDDWRPPEPQTAGTKKAG